MNLSHYRDAEGAQRYRCRLMCEEACKELVTCLMGTAPNGVNLCYVAYGFSGVSILATAALSLLQCCTCNLCGLGFVLDTVFAAAGTGWWAVAAVVFGFYARQPETAALPQANWRQWVIILSWVSEHMEEEKGGRAGG